VSEVADTPARLIAAAERLFAEGGEGGTSLRAIARAARANAAAVHYHFGGRDELLSAVVDRHIGPLTGRRLQLLDEAVARHGEPVPVTALLAAVLRPDLELLARLRRHKVEVARFLGRATTLAVPPGLPYPDRHSEPLPGRLVPLLRASLPDVGAAELRHRLRLVLACVGVLFANAPDPGEPGPLGTDDVDEQVQRLVAFCAAGLSAPAAQAPPPVAQAPSVAQPERDRRKRRRKALT